MSDAIDFRKLPAVLRLRPISLEEMKGIRLMNRTDTKFITSETILCDILTDAESAGYRICTINGEKVLGYTSLYWDTPDLKMYLAHHNSRKVRQKVRTRTYDVSGDTYLEIKRKNNHGRTKKKRVAIPLEEFSGFSCDSAACRYLAEHSWFRAAELIPRCTTEFKRITLVNKELTERLTIDLLLHFRNYTTGNCASLHDAVIIELKQDGRAYSPMKEILLKHRVKPYRVSKYCIGNVITDPGLKANRFKEKIHYIEKIIDRKLI